MSLRLTYCYVVKYVNTVCISLANASKFQEKYWRYVSSLIKQMCRSFCMECIIKTPGSEGLTSSLSFSWSFLYWLLFFVSYCLLSYAMQNRFSCLCIVYASLSGADEIGFNNLFELSFIRKKGNFTNLLEYISTYGHAIDVAIHVVPNKNIGSERFLISIKSWRNVYLLLLSSMHEHMEI